MGSAWSCFGSDRADEDRRGCLSCIDCLFTPVLHACYSLIHGAHPESQYQSLVAPEPVIDDSSCDTYCPPPRPLAFDDPRCSYKYSAGIISPSDKASSHLCVMADLDATNDVSHGESLVADEKFKDPDAIPLKQAPRGLEYGLLFAYASSEEDSCPICLEEYFMENPKIMLRCMHHFHLSCIYEWMERSEACPICGKVMELDEET